jgi:hypothetical protein
LSLVKGRVANNLQGTLVKQSPTLEWLNWNAHVQLLLDFVLVESTQAHLDGNKLDVLGVLTEDHSCTQYEALLVLKHLLGTNKGMGQTYDVGPNKLGIMRSGFLWRSIYMSQNGRRLRLGNKGNHMFVFWGRWNSWLVSDVFRWVAGGRLMGCGWAGGVSSPASSADLRFFRYRRCIMAYRSGGAICKWKTSLQLCSPLQSQIYIFQN